MMVPKKSLVLTGASLIALGAFAGAQSQSGKFFSRYTKPLRTVSMNLETGTVTRGPQVSNQVTTTTIDFDNLDLGGFIGVDTGGGFCEWIDSGAKGAQGPVPSDLVSNFVFAYCSAALDTNSGGPGGTMRWTFYPSHTTGAAHPATSSAVGAFTLQGLPSNTTTGTVFAQIACFFINITFGNLPLPFADGQIGYSWTFVDLDMGSGGGAGVFAATFPFLSCVSSCSGGGLDGWGMDDMVDQYCPAEIGGATPLATFSFGTTVFGGYFTSVNIDLREVDVTATVSSVGHPLNDDIMTTSPVVIGGTWTSSITPGPLRTTGTPLGGLYVALVQSALGGPVILDASALLAGAPFFLLPPGSDAPLSAVLFGGSSLGSTSGNWSTGSGGTINIPANTNFLCLTWAAQSVVFGDILADGDVEADAKFSSATTGVVGSQ